MDEKDRLLLTYLQNGLPLTLRPFEVWSSKLGVDSAELLVRIQRLKKEGRPRENFHGASFGGIKAIWNSRAFHYQSAWVAMEIRKAHEGKEPQVHCEELRSRTEVIWEHPGVIYGCQREHEFNVWFFLAVPSGHDLELHVRCLEKLAGAHQTLFLPLRKVFKGEDFLSSLDGKTFPFVNERFDQRQKIGLGIDLAPEEMDMIRQLQEPFPLTDEPYREIAARAKTTEARVLERLKALTGKGYLKRIGSFSKPAEAALAAKALVVWRIPEEKLERCGPAMAEFHEVFYADRRPAYPEFPFSLYTMILAKTAAEVEVVTRHIQDRIGKWPHRVLETVQEFKKERLKYFPKELDAWWLGSRRVVETEFI